MLNEINAESSRLFVNNSQASVIDTNNPIRSSYDVSEEQFKKLYMHLARAIK